MYEALIKNSSKLIYIDEFKRKYGLKSLDKGLELICPSCKNDLHVYAKSSIKVSARFHHGPGSSCLYVDGREGYLSLPNSWDIENGIKIRDALENKEFISKLYCFCLKLCGKGTLPVDKFLNLVKKADKRNLWACSGLEDWVIGFLLLVLDDFTGQTDAGRSYVFRFFLEKNRIDKSAYLEKNQKKIDINEILKGEEFFLVRVFDNGKIKNFPAGNPYPVIKDIWLEFTQNFEWAYLNHGEKLVTRIQRLRE